jgi:hypothetical protein
MQQILSAVPGVTVKPVQIAPANGNGQSNGNGHANGNSAVQVEKPEPEAAVAGD